MGRHVTRALLTASRPDGWEFVEKLLLAAQREDGLRQMAQQVGEKQRDQQDQRAGRADRDVEQRGLDQCLKKPWSLTRDRAQFESYEESLLAELQDYLAENARREKYVLLSPPKVLMETDEDLEVGEFGIATRMAQGSGPQPVPDEAPVPDVAPGATMVYKPKQPDTEAVSAEELGLEREIATLSWNGKQHEIEKRRVVIGRSKDADIQVEDPNVSRRHAEVRQEGAAYWVVDLDSTNGTEINGRRLKRAKLRPGDTITVGSTEVVFRRESGG